MLIVPQAPEWLEPALTHKFASSRGITARSCSTGNHLIQRTECTNAVGMGPCHFLCNSLLAIAQNKTAIKS